MVSWATPARPSVSIVLATQNTYSFRAVGRTPPRGQWNDCGSGCGPWTCGKPVQTICSGVCISQCECGAGQGWDPVEGCVTCTCAQWFETWQSLLAQVAQCSGADDCPAADGFACVDGKCAWNYL